MPRPLSSSGGRCWRDPDLEVEIVGPSPVGRFRLASGSVVGGVIGHRRILFDLWGDTVNTAARMESSGTPGRIHLAASSRQLLGNHYAFEERRVDVKGLGQMTTFLLADV